MSDDGHNAIDRLKDEARIKGESRMILNTTEPADVNAQQREAVIVGVLDYIDQTGIRRAQIARDIGIAGTTLGTVLNRRYPGNANQIILDLDRWLEDQQKRDAAPKHTTCVKTQVAEEIYAAADAASKLKTIAMVYGPSGIGKTLTLEAIRDELPGAILITAEKEEPTASAIIRAIAIELRIGSSIYNKRYNYQNIKEKLKGTSRLLMIDQIHSLCGGDDKVFHVLTDIYNATKSPQLWAGTTDLPAYFDKARGKGREPISQVSRRMMPIVDLMDRTRSYGGDGGEPLFSLEEIRKVFGKGKMRLAPDSAKYLMILANLPESGSIGLCANLVRMATLLYERKSDVLIADMLRDAHKLLLCRRVYNGVKTQMEAPIRMSKTG